MKNLYVEELGLEELSEKEAKETNGGWFIFAGIAAVLTVMTVVTIVKVTE